MSHNFRVVVYSSHSNIQTCFETRTCVETIYMFTESTPFVVAFFQQRTMTTSERERPRLDKYVFITTFYSHFRHRILQARFVFVAEFWNDLSWASIHDCEILGN